MKVELPVRPASPLPPLYAAWIDELFAGPIPEESNATCSDCAMCSPEHPGGSEFFFNAQTKCCTYVPRLPNYLVGRILGDADPAFAEGRNTVGERLRAGVAVTPLGLGRPPVFDQLYRRNPRGFGHSRSWRCPHYLEEGGRCGVWKHRAAVCATWFCKYVRGEVGRGFWQAVHRLLSHVEQSLAAWCVLELDVGAAALDCLFPPPQFPDRNKGMDSYALDGRVDPAAYRLVWGNWLGREAEFYQECAGRVKALTWQQVLALGGPQVRASARLAQDAYRKLVTHDMPTALKVGSFQILNLTVENGCVSAYAGSEFLELPRELLDVLGYFDGRPTTDALHDILMDKGLDIEPELVRKLADFGILIPCESTTRNSN
jgi:hypothetical protein